MFDWIVAGAGFTGATLAERIATQVGGKVLVVDRRDHIGGNAYDAPDEAGILVHKYGPHIFHTNSEQVWRYLQTFSSWRPYVHRALAMIDGKRVPIPFNLNTIDMVFPRDLAQRYTEALLDRFRYGDRIPILKLMKEDGDLGALANFIYEKVFRNYTLKQWGLTPEHLLPSVTARVPVVVARDDRYFHDKYQAMPAEGYTKLFERMLDHPNITVRLKTDFREICGKFPSARVVFTGPIDEFFDFRFGHLPYRSLRFVSETVDQEQVQTVATINYPSDKYAFTRVTEMKHLTGQIAERSTLLYEYPEPHVPGVNEPYYPIPREETQKHLDKYLDLAKRDDAVLCGRLGDYQYYNMDQAIGAALARFGKLTDRSVARPAGEIAGGGDAR